MSTARITILVDNGVRGGWEPVATKYLESLTIYCSTTARMRKFTPERRTSPSARNLKTEGE